MTLRLAAIVERPPRALPEGARLVGDGPWLVVEPDDAEALERRLRSRIALLRALARESACLPCRIDAAAADEAEALAWLGRHADAARAALARVSGRAELDLHVSLPALADAGADGAGTRHLRALAARYAALDPASVEALAAAVRSALPGVADVASGGAFVAFLVDDPRAFRARAASLALERYLPEGASTRWSGPWPAFTFAAAWLGEEAA